MNFASTECQAVTRLVGVTPRCARIAAKRGPDAPEACLQSARVAGRQVGLERVKKVLTVRRPRGPAALGSWREPCRPMAATVGSADRTRRWGSTGCRQLCRRIHARTAFGSTSSSSASCRTVSDEASISAPYLSANRPQTGPSRRRGQRIGIGLSRVDSLRSLNARGMSHMRQRENRPSPGQSKTPAM